MTSTFKKKTQNTVFFRYSPADISITRKNFETFFSDIGPVKKCSLIRQDKAKSENNRREARGYGFCKFTCQEDAIAAEKTLNEISMQLEYGQKIKVWVELADTAAAAKKEEGKGKRQKQKLSSLPERTPGEGSMTNARAETSIETALDHTETSDEILALQAKKRTSRVILRNLSFYATEHNIRQVMEEKFGEVVDINLPLVPNQGDAGSSDRRSGKRRAQHRGFAFVTFANQNSAHKAVDACAGEEQVLIKKRPVAIDFSVSKFQHRRMQEEEKAEDHAKETESESDSGTGSESDDENTGSGSSSDDDGSDEESADSDSEADNDSDEQMQDDEKKLPENSHQHSLFLRNLPFDATRHDLFTLFAQYGHIAGIFLVKDRDTGIGKGTAFVKFSREGGCVRALEASQAGGADTQSFKSGKNIGEDGNSGGGLYLKGRRIFVDLAVDKSTADTLKVERDEDGKPIQKNIGKDKRNLYLKGEGRVQSDEDSGKGGNDPDAWENLPQSDQLKRGRAHQEKSTKLRSPLFFINPFRLSIRNLAKHIDENQLKQLMAKGVLNGLKNGLVTKDDMIAHWRASDELDTRAILEKIAVGEKERSLIPHFEEKHIKRYIPSVFIDRDFQATMKQADKGKGQRLVAPSRGFGFAEFTYHAHAMACLRELNNNTEYTSEFVSGGKRALEMKKQRSKKKSKSKKMNPDADLDDGPKGADFVGDDGKVRLPRLVVEFTVENKAKARKQAENKAKQLENSKRQKIAAKTSSTPDSREKLKKKMGRGAQQRAKKRRMIAEGLLDENGNKIGDKKMKTQKTESSKTEEESKPQEKKKGIKPPRKAKKVDKEEKSFEDMVRSYKNTFSSVSENKVENTSSNPRDALSKRRWFD